MSEFVYKIDILSENRVELFREFTNKHYKDFVKVIVNEDKDIFERFVDNIISELCIGKINVQKLTSLEKMYIMVVLRAYNISPGISFTTETDETTEEGKPVMLNINISVVEIAQKIENIPVTPNFKIQSGDVVVNGSLPKKFYYTDPQLAVADCITDIILPTGKVIDLSPLELHQKQEILDTLPSHVLPSVFEFLTKQEEAVKKEPLLVIDTDKNINTDKETHIALFNGSMAEIIKLLYRVNLKEFYVNEYSLIKKFKFSYDQLQRITPGELAVYTEVIQEDMKREKQEMEKQRHEQNQVFLPPQ